MLLSQCQAVRTRPELKAAVKLLGFGAKPDALASPATPTAPISDKVRMQRAILCLETAKGGPLVGTLNNINAAIKLLKDGM